MSQANSTQRNDAKDASGRRRLTCGHWAGPPSRSLHTGETETIVKRIGNRQKNRGGERISAEVQDLCFTYWEFGKHNQRIREISKHKTKYAHVFQYYRRELKAIGITAAEEFAKALVLRSKRISRNQGK